MKVTLLGTGTPASRDRFQSSALIEVGSDLLLFDTGRGAVHQLLQAGIDLGRIGPIFITHHHVDHINDLYDVIFSTAGHGRRGPLPIYGPAGTQEIVDALLNGVYAKDNRFRLEEDRVLQLRGELRARSAEAYHDVAVNEIGSGIAAEGDGWRMLSEYVLHGDFPQAPDFEWHCLGYRIEAQGQVVTISGDTVPCPGINSLARDADLLVQCCMWSESGLTNPGLRILTESVLPSTTQAGVKRMVLTHLSASVNREEALAEVRQQYSGEVLFGEDLLVIE
jgi:ribonuclease Z